MIIKSFNKKKIYYFLLKAVYIKLMLNINIKIINRNNIYNIRN